MSPRPIGASSVIVTGRASSGCDVGRVAVDDVGGAGDVVEPEEDVGDHEPALGDVRALLGQVHGRLELRDVVVAQVADDGCIDRLRLVEGDEPVAAADKGMAAEPTLVDRLEQERGSPVSAQAKVRRERRQEVGIEVRSCHRKKKTTLLGSRSSGAGCGALLRAQAPAPLMAPCPPGRVGR